MPRTVITLGAAALLCGVIAAASAQTTSPSAPPSASAQPTGSPAATSAPSADIPAPTTTPPGATAPIQPTGPTTSLAPLPNLGPPPALPQLTPTPITSAIPTTVSADAPVTGTAPAQQRQIAKPYATVPPVQVGGSITAPDNQTGPTVTIDQVVTEVLQVNPTVVQAVETAQRAHAQVGEATGQLLPQISAQAVDTYSGVATSGVGASELNSISPVATVPTIDDTAFQSLQSGVSESLSGTSPSSETLSTGSGSSTTTTTTTTIVPVSPVSGGGGSSSSGSSSSSSGGGSSSGSSSAVSPGSFGTTGSAASSDARSVGNVQPNATGTTTTGTTGTTGGTGTTTNAASTVTTIFQNNDRHNNYDASGVITQYLDVFGLGRANVNATKQSALFYDLDAIRVENDTALNAKDTYFAIIQAQSDVSTSQEQLRNAQAILHDAEVEYQAGAQPEYDVVSAQAQVASAQEALIQAQNSLDVQRADLNNYLNRPVDAPISVTPAPMYIVPSTTPIGPEIAAAFRGRPEMQQATLTQQIASNETKLAHAGQLPTIGLTGSLDYQPYVNSVTSGTSSHYTEAISAGIDIPLYDGGQTRSRVKAARIEQAIEHSVADQLVQDIALEVTTALTNVVDAQALVSSDQSAVAENREALREAQIRYTSGVGTLLEVTNAEANLANAEDSLNSAVYQQQSAYAALQRAEGKR